MTTATKNNWYVISPEGSAWIAVRVDHNYEVVESVEQADAATHIAARDQYAAVCEAIRDCRVDEHVPLDIAVMIIESWDSEIDPSMVVVESVVFAD